MTVNPMGAVQLADWGIPQVLSCTTNNAVTGGQIAYLVSGANRTVTSGLSSFAVTDLVIDVSASGINFPIGVVTQTAGSNTIVGVAVRGVFLLPASTALTCGDTVACVNGADAVDVITSGTSMPQLDFKQRVGKALTSAASGAFSAIAVSIV